MHPIFWVFYLSATLPSISDVLESDVFLSNAVGFIIDLF